MKDHSVKGPSWAESIFGAVTAHSTVCAKNVKVKSEYLKRYNSRDRKYLTIEELCDISSNIMVERALEISLLGAESAKVHNKGRRL